jgi:cold shock CspA family protein
VDEYGNLSSTPPDPANKTEVKAEDIVLGVPKRESEPRMAAVRTGIVTMFNASKGYGFIKDDGTKESVFTHVNQHLEEIHENDRVTYRVERSHKGQNAVEVKKVPK